MGLGTAFHLSERGYRVTLLEKQKDVAKVASYINGAMICPSMTASWASLSLLSKVICFLWHIYLKFVHLLKFIYSEKATKFCEIVTLLLSVCTVDKSKVKDHKFRRASGHVDESRGCVHTKFWQPP